jgi:hypothetical protein
MAISLEKRLCKSDAVYTDVERRLVAVSVVINATTTDASATPSSHRGYISNGVLLRFIQSSGPIDEGLLHCRRQSSVESSCVAKLNLTAARPAYDP